jgi:glycosyltransferase involved in cell wall biosynthesis
MTITVPTSTLPGVQAESPVNWEGISVVIPTYNRAEKLLRVLESLQRQTLDKRCFEVIVIDDGSTDTTRQAVSRFAAGSSLNLRYLPQEHRRPAAARNTGIEMAEMPLVFFIGDDIILEANTVEEHLRFHRQHNVVGDVAVLGRTEWPKELHTTPFMRYIGEHGPQFGYAKIRGNGSLPFDFFYTSNVSLPRAMFNGLNQAFDEQFESAALEDVELGYRLQQRGMRLLYHPGAVGYHDHGTDVRRFCRRQYAVGRASRVLLRKHPELEPHYGTLDRMERLAAATPLLPLVEWVAGFLDSRIGAPLPRLVYRAMLHLNYAKGATRG